MIQNFKLIEKKNLTHNVFEMHFECEKEMEMKSGQFVTFLLDKIGGRAYSILRIEGNTIILIIKKRELSDGGRGGSKFICEILIGDILKGVGPAGHFVLKENNNNKLFIGTGTGFVPLWNQINGAISQKQESKLKLLFGVREERDLFYVDEIINTKTNNNNFDYKLYLSKTDDVQNGYNKGYTTSYLTKENCDNFQEFYICGAPAMIESSVKKLKELGVADENIYYEKY